MISNMESFRLHGGALGDQRFGFKLLDPVLYGEVQGKVSAVVLLMENIDRNAVATTDYLAHHFVFQVDAKHKVVVAAMGSPTTLCGDTTIEEARWAIEGGALAEYTRNPYRVAAGIGTWTRVRFAFDRPITPADYSPADLPVGAKDLIGGKASDVSDPAPAAGPYWRPPGPDGSGPRGRIVKSDVEERQARRGQAGCSGNACHRRWRHSRRGAASRCAPALSGRQL